MPQQYDNNIGRLRVTVNHDGAKMHNYKQGGNIIIREGFNSSCPWIDNVMSVEEMRDLRYLLDRAIAAAEST